MRVPIRSLLAAALLAAAAAASGQNAIIAPEAIHHPVFAENGMVATQEAIATGIGVDVLRRGGNAVDAAVTVGFALAVTLPRAGNLGGGGFMLVHAAEAGETVALDYRETAPAGATADMFLDARGEVEPSRSRFTRLAAGVPGTVAGLAHALERWGTIPLAEAIAPALRLAREGFPVAPELARSIAAARDRLARDANAARIFLHADGSAPRAGDVLVQPDLARTLERIARDGPDAFYRGAIAESIAADMAANGGLITAADLDAYRAVEREPVRGTYRGFAIASMPPPSSGGVHLVQILNILEPFPLGFLGPGSADTMHVMAEAMKLAYADRAKHLGDPDFWPVPVAGLTSKDYAARLRARMALDRARPSSEIAAGDPPPAESTETTHFSVMDGAGNVVSNTYTINFSFGSGIVAGDTGVLLNNEMDDFSAKPGVPNAYGLVGGEANAIEPGKRPLSSMTPTIVLRDGAPVLATGSPGGSRIITTTLQILVNVIDHGMNVAEASAAPRMHHQWLPDELRIERGFSPDTLDALAARGHALAVKRAMGATQTIRRAPEGFYGASDPRAPGGLAAGY